MGDIAEGILNGDFDEVTGEYLGEGEGYPRTFMRTKWPGRYVESSIARIIADERLNTPTFRVIQDGYQIIFNGNKFTLAFYCNYDKERCDISGNFARDADGDYILNFGKEKGKKAKDVISYLNWMNKQDFMPDTKAIIQQFI